MKSEKQTKTTKQDKVWQQTIEKRLKAEKVELDHPKGKEQFLQAIQHAVKKPKSHHK